jgi:uncharacterized protein (DUF2235 family)
MAKNILIFSDGTGQRGGVTVEERRSNVYKLYRATRCGPDSCIDPAEQFAFYDAGIGTVPGGITGFGRFGRWLYNLLGQATGLGLTANIVDCYAAIIRVWEPGDRIFLFGFSRGAYTVRCVGGVLGLCGVPTRAADGGPLKRDPASAGRLAKKAVRRVYQHFRPVKETPSPDARPDDLRKALAQRFRAAHGSDADGKSNAFPHFIGVFDTVASLANRFVLVVLAVVSVALLAAISYGLSYLFWTFCLWFLTLAGLAVLAALLAYLWTHVKIAFNLPGYRWWQTLRITPLWMQFYDRNLSRDVGFARHALAIDERRKSFNRVAWGSPSDSKQTQPEWFEQIWFAGNHSDIGGSYLETESRLSDIPLAWMVAAAQAVPGGIKIDPSVLRLYPSAAGMQHDEAKRGLFKYAGTIIRTIPPNAPLHETVYERAALATVLNYDLTEPYRPKGLETHTEFCRRCGKGAEAGR